MSGEIPQIIESVAAAAVPVGTAVVAWIRWRNKVVADRDSRAQIAINAAEKAASAARAAERERTNELLNDRQATIDRLEVMLRDEQRQNATLQERLVDGDNRGRSRRDDHA